MGNVQTDPPIQPLPIMMDCEHERKWLEMTGIRFPNPPQSDRDLLMDGTIWSGRINRAMIILLLLIAIEIGIIVGYIVITQNTMFGALTTDITILTYLLYALGIIMMQGWFSADKGLMCIDWILMLTISFFFLATLTLWVSQFIVTFNEAFFTYPPGAEPPISTHYSQSKKVAFYFAFFIETFELSWCLVFIWYYAEAHTWGTPEPEVHAAYRRLFAGIYPHKVWNLHINVKMDYTYSRALPTHPHSHSHSHLPIAQQIWQQPPTNITMRESRTGLKTALRNGYQSEPRSQPHCFIPPSESR
jgi:hypothetical protein